MWATNSEGEDSISGGVGTGTNRVGVGGIYGNKLQWPTFMRYYVETLWFAC